MGVVMAKPVITKEQMYERLVELEEKEEAGILIERLTRLEQNPQLAVPWETVRRSGK